MFDRIAEELKKARLKNNLTLRQLTSRTRIDIKFLEAMEEGNFSFLPEIYVKAFIKEYADVVGLDGDLILKKYEAAKEGLPFEEVSENISGQEIKDETIKPDEEKKDEEKPAQEKPKDNIEKPAEVKQPPFQPKPVDNPKVVFDSTHAPGSDSKAGNKNIYIIGAAVIGAVVLIGLIYLIFFKSSNEIIVTEKPYDEIINETQKRYEEKTAAVNDSSQNSMTASDSLNLLIQTTDTSWVKIVFDNSKTEEFILFPNSQKSLKTANNFNITFGRSAAIKLQLNNKPLAFNPGTKSVSYVLITSKGLEYLKKPPEGGREQ